MLVLELPVENVSGHKQARLDLRNGRVCQVSLGIELCINLVEKSVASKWPQLQHAAFCTIEETRTRGVVVFARPHALVYCAGVFVFFILQGHSSQGGCVSTVLPLEWAETILKKITQI